MTLRTLAPATPLSASAGSFAGSHAALRGTVACRHEANAAGDVTHLTHNPDLAAELPAGTVFVAGESVEKLRR